MHSSAAFLSSQIQSENLCSKLLCLDTVAPSPSTDVALLHLSKQLQEETLVIGQVNLISQRELSSRVDQVVQQQLEESMTAVTDKARLASLGLPHSGDWLEVVPCPALGLRLRGPEFRISVLYRLGMPVFPADGFCVACSAESDSTGHHAISCGSQGERIARHNHLRDAIYAMASSAHLAPTKEDRALLPNCDGRPADVLIGHFEAGLHAALDISVINPMQTATVNRAAVEPGFAANMRHEQKLAKYGDRCLAEGIKFCPIVCESTGRWHREAVSILKRIGQALARARGG